VAGVLVALVDGTCAAVGGVEVAAPAPGTAVVVPGG
jgi:Ni,Fe-hydrogenase I small subunit